MPQEIAVRNVAGRYPSGTAPFFSDNIVASVSEVARVFRIRLDDIEHPDAWTEITIEVSGDEIIIAEPLDPLSMEPDDIPF